MSILFHHLTSFYRYVLPTLLFRNHLTPIHSSSTPHSTLLTDPSLTNPKPRSPITRRLVYQRHRRLEIRHYTDIELRAIPSQMWAEQDDQGALSSYPEFVRRKVPCGLVKEGEEEARLLRGRVDNNLIHRLNQQAAYFLSLLPAPEP